MEVTLTKFIGKVLNLTDAEVADIAKADDAETQLESLYTKSLADKQKVYRKEGRDSATGEIQKKLNAKAKELFAVEDEADSITGVLELVKGSIKPTDPTQTPDLTEAAVKKSPFYADLEKTFNAYKKEAETTLKAKETEFSKQLGFVRLEKDAVSALELHKAKLPSHEFQRKVLVEKYLDQYKNLDVQEVDGNKQYYDTATNKRLEDGYGNPLTWEQVTEKLVKSSFETETTQKTTPGIDPNRQTPPPPASTPKTIDELNTYLSDQNVSQADKNAAYKAYYNQG